MFFMYCSPFGGCKQINKKNNNNDSLLTKRQQQNTVRSSLECKKYLTLLRICKLDVITYDVNYQDILKVQCILGVDKDNVISLSPVFSTLIIKDKSQLIISLVSRYYHFYWNWGCSWISINICASFMIAMTYISRHVFDNKLKLRDRYGLIPFAHFCRRVALSVHLSIYKIRRAELTLLASVHVIMSVPASIKYFQTSS